MFAKMSPLKGNACFDFLLITQQALCSLVNCPGPLASQWGCKTVRKYIIRSSNLQPLVHPP